MINTLLAKVIGTQNERELKKLRPIVGRINELEASVRELSDAALREKTPGFRERVERG
jgi:preprotein translocase subunit SecA